MKTMKWNALPRGQAGWRTGRAAWAAVCATALGLAASSLLPAFANEENASLRDKGPISFMGPPPEPPPMAPVGDETVGTLPVLAGGSPIVLVRDAEITIPSFFVEGNVYDLQNAFVAVAGDCLAQVDVIDAPSHRVRLTFPGRSGLALDRQLVENTDLEFGLWVPAPTPYAYPVGFWGKRTLAFESSQSRVGLPISPMSSVGALQVNPLVVFAPGLTADTELHVRTSTDLLIVQQSHTP